MAVIKRIAAIHDISGVGKCSLTAAIPVISAFGIECNPVPTAVLSTHTGDISGYTFRDLSDDILPVCRHWKSLGICPDTIYSGYLGSGRQVEDVKRIIDMFSSSGKAPFVAVDPAMADSGVLYKGFDDDFPGKMAELCKKADLIIPNITEACMITGVPYREEYDRRFIESLAAELSDYTKKYVVITGVSFEKDKIGCCVYYNGTGEYFFTQRYPGIYYGTGDLFASVLVSSMTLGRSCSESARIALDFTARAIKETYDEGTDPRFGVAFEKFLPLLTAAREETK